MRSLLAGFAFVALLTAGCSDSHSGFRCSTPSMPSFDSTDCRARLAKSSCADGGVESRGPSTDGGFQQLCCVYQDCRLGPFDDLHP